MSRIKITTLTPVHIGSGRDLMKNTEFLIQGERIGVVDDKKVVDVIGVENIDKWVNIIDKRESLWEYLKLRKPDVVLEDVSNRTMTVYGSDIAAKQTLKEQLHSADLLPMIPGSSIKGAIRTAIIAKLVNENTEKVSKVINRKKIHFKQEFEKKKAKNYKLEDEKWQWSLRDFQQTESAILNKLLSGTDKMDANKNIFRFLQVSDFVFEYETIASNLRVMNFYGNKWDFKKDSDQLTEMIAPGCEAEGRIVIKKDLLKKNKEKRAINVDTSFLTSLKGLFKIINNHTKLLLQNEIRLWEEDNHRKNDVLSNYLDNLRSIFEEAENIRENETIIRIGGGSGWDSITGAWIKNNANLLNDDEYHTLIRLLNKRRNVEYFPKTRKIDEDGDLLGFVKMEILE